MTQVAGVLNVLLLMANVIGCSQIQAKDAPPVVQCDVINEDFCFALPLGATSTLSIPVDFKLYEVQLANQQKILVYYGTQPNYPEQAPVLSKVSGAEKVSLYRQASNGQQRIDAFYEETQKKFTIVVHVQATYDSDAKASVAEFLNSFKECKSERKGLTACTSEPLFAAVVDLIKRDRIIRKRAGKGGKGDGGNWDGKRGPGKGDGGN